MPAAERPLPRFSDRSIGLAAAVVTVLVWTAFIVVARASAAHSLGPLDLAFARIAGASVVLLPWGAWLVMRDRAARPGPAGRPAASLFGLSPLALRVTLIGGAFGGVAYATFAYMGFFFAPAGHASVLMPGSLPLWTTLLAAWLLRDRLTLTRAIGLAFIVAGDLVVGGRSLLHAFEGGEVWKGDLLFMAAAFCWACYSIVARHHRLDAVRATIAITAFAFMAFLPVYTLLVALGAVQSRFGSAPVGEIVFQMAFQGIGSVVISGIAFTRMIQYFGPVRSTMITALVPGLSALGAVVFLDEPLSWSLWLGLGLVTAGILFGVRRSATAVLPVEPVAGPAPPVARRCDA